MADPRMDPGLTVRGARARHHMTAGATPGAEAESTTGGTRVEVRRTAVARPVSGLRGSVRWMRLDPVLVDSRDPVSRRGSIGTQEHWAGLARRSLRERGGSGLRARGGDPVRDRIGPNSVARWIRERPSLGNRAGRRASMAAGQWLPALRRAGSLQACVARVPPENLGRGAGHFDPCVRDRAARHDRAEPRAAERTSPARGHRPTGPHQVRAVRARVPGRRGARASRPRACQHQNRTASPCLGGLRNRSACAFRRREWVPRRARQNAIRAPYPGPRMSAWRAGRSGRRRQR